jgi:hypothetical protein
MKNPNGLLDRHKISACIYYAIVEASIIKIMGGTAEKERLVNSEFAFYVSLSVLLSFMANNADAEYSQYLADNGLEMPPYKDTSSNESYLVQTVKALCHAKRRNKLDGLQLANIFFMLECYNDLVYKTNH